jgi:GNAT superfamily N-acetyltransferase
VATLSVLGWPDDAPRLDLDHERFAYAGKFVTGRAGVAVARADAPGREAEGPADGHESDVLAAVSFSPDRTDETTLRIRYVTVREDRRGERLGPRLCAFVARRARERGYDRVAIAVNNPFAFVALYRAGFGATGEETGLAERVLVAPDPTDRDPAAYRAGLASFAERDLPPEARAFVERRRAEEPPGVVAEADGDEEPPGDERTDDEPRA